jgi:hypothetical protein
MLYLYTQSGHWITHVFQLTAEDVRRSSFSCADANLLLLLPVLRISSPATPTKDTC